MAHLVRLCFAFGMLQDRDLIRGRQDAVFEELGSEERVDDGGFPAVELAYENKKEGLI